MAESLTLSNGVNMPSVGLGTYKARGTCVVDAVRWALQAGIRSIDSASIYRVGFQGRHMRFEALHTMKDMRM